MKKNYKKNYEKKPGETEWFVWSTKYDPTRRYY